MRVKVWLSVLMTILVAFGCYEWLVGGYAFVGIVFSGLGTLISFIQLILQSPLQKWLRSRNKAKNNLASPPAPTSVKNPWSSNLEERDRQSVFNQFPYKAEDKVGLMQSEHAIGVQKISRSETVKNIALICSFCFCIMMFVFAVVMISSASSAPRGQCIILTKDVFDVGYSFDGNSTVDAYELQFTLRLQTNNKQVYPSVSGNTSIYQGNMYSDIKEAQQQLTHYIVGKTYSCQYQLLFGSVFDVWLLSDKPLSSNGPPVEIIERRFSR